MKILKGLFEEANLIQKRFLSPKVSRVPSIMYVIVKKLGNVWGSNQENPDYCPKCEAKSLSHKGNLLGRILIRIIWRIDKLSLFRKPVWIGCLYKKRY